MAMKSNGGDRRLRLLVAQEAARIMYEQSIRDYRKAKQKACARLGVSMDMPMPRNEEIQTALQDYVRIFKSDSQACLLHELRSTACEAMRFLARFNPHLVGAVVNGTADPHAPVHLHLFAETPEQVLLFLQDQHIAFQVYDRLVRYSDGREEKVPMLVFMADEITVELSVFPPDAIRQAPCSPVDGKPLKRQSLAELEMLLGSAI